MNVSELIDRMTGIGASISAEGDELAVRFPEQCTRDVEELAPAIRELKPKLLRVLGGKIGEPGQLKDIELALHIYSHLVSLPAFQSATACEVAGALHGRNYTLDHVIEVYRACEQLLEARILIRGRDGYGFQLDVPAPRIGASANAE
jgi:hypothetical protein